MEQSLHIVFSAALHNAGMSTRALELAMGIREHCPSGRQVTITFLSHGGCYESMVLEQGFKVYRCKPEVEGRSIINDLPLRMPMIVKSVDLASTLLQSELNALIELQPDIVIYGFWPFAGIACQMLNIPAICFLPLPLHPQCMAFLLEDISDEMIPLAYLPTALRRTLIKAVPPVVKRHLPVFNQYNLQKAAEKCGWTDRPPKTIFDVLQADLTLIMDLPDFYVGQSLPETFCITGPLFAQAQTDVPLDPAILHTFDPKNQKPKVFCTMGSSGTKSALLEAIKALASGKGREWNAVIVALPAVCPLNEALACAGERSDLVITDRFVPASVINALADVVICHGGQGTLQTALASGTPLIGVAMQPQQQIDLDHVVMRGAGIRIPIHRWKAPSIQAAVNTVLSQPMYRTNARQMQKHLQSIDGKRNAAEAVWQYINTNLKVKTT